jgi:hypothetical protein
MFVGSVLVVASAATLEVRAAWCDAIGRWGGDFVELGAGEAGLLLGQGSGDGLAFERERDEDCFAFALRAADRSVRATLGGEAGEPIAAVDEFFDSEVQVVIVRGGDAGSDLFPLERGRSSQKSRFFAALRMTRSKE